MCSSVKWWLSRAGHMALKESEPGSLMTCAFLLSQGHWAPHTTKDTPCKVCNRYLMVAMRKVVVDTHTITQAWCRRGSTALKALVVAQNGRHKVPWGDKKRNGGSGLGLGTGAPCFVSPRCWEGGMTSPLIPVHGSGTYFKTISSPATVTWFKTSI